MAIRNGTVGAVCIVLVVFVLVDSSVVGAPVQGRGDSSDPTNPPKPPRETKPKTPKIKHRVKSVHTSFGPDFEDEKPGPHCYNQYVKHLMGRANWACCEHTGHFMTGIYYLGGHDTKKSHEFGRVVFGREGGLHRIDYLRCCRPSYRLGTHVLTGGSLLELGEGTGNSIGVDVSRVPTSIDDEGVTPPEAIGMVPTDQLRSQQRASGISSSTRRAMARDENFISFLELESSQHHGRRLTKAVSKKSHHLNRHTSGHSGQVKLRPDGAPPMEDGLRDDSDGEVISKKHVHKEKAKGDRAPDTNSVEGSYAETGISDLKNSYWCDCYSYWLPHRWTSGHGKHGYSATEMCNRRGYFMIGFFRGGHEGCDYAYCIHGFRCCRPCIQLGNTLGLLQLSEKSEPSVFSEWEKSKVSRSHSNPELQGKQQVETTRSLSASEPEKQSLRPAETGVQDTDRIQKNLGNSVTRRGSWTDMFRPSNLGALNLLQLPDDRGGTSFRAKQCECKRLYFGRLRRYQHCPPDKYMVGMEKNRGYEVWRLRAFRCCDPCLHMGSDIF